MIKSSKDILPIGTIVIMENGNTPLMIIGYMPTDAEGRNYDYLCVAYPDGYEGEEPFFLIYHEDIASIVFRGMEDNAFDDMISDRFFF